MLLLVVATTCLMLWVLLEQANGIDDPEKRTTLRIDAIKTALTSGAGAAGLVALFLGLRRQWLSEWAQVQSDIDSTERKATELYATAASGLASELLPARLASVFALDRLASEHLEHRQMTLNLLTAYLRGSTSDEDRVCRLTIMNLICDHLASGRGVGGRDWRDLDLQLYGTTLSNYLICDVPVKRLWFEKSIAKNDIVFYGAVVESSAYCNDAVFERYCDFGQGSFRGLVEFNRVKFGGMVSFGGAQFAGAASFSESRFEAEADFSDAVFESKADFSRIEGAGRLDFSRAVFKLGFTFDVDQANIDLSSALIQASSTGSLPNGWTTRATADPGVLEVVRV